MRDDADFAAYAVARWPSLVRSLVLLGSPAQEAHDLARTVLAQLRSDWRHRDELGDIDEHTALTLLEARRRAHPTGRAARDAPSDHAALVLQALLDVDGEAPESDLQPVREEADEVVVEPLDLGEVVVLEQQQRRARRRRTTRIVVVAVVVLAVVAAGWTWWVTRTAQPEDLPDAPVEEVDNPVPVGWYTGDTLHLDRVALTIDDLQSFAQVPQGAVYSDTAGEMVLVEPDGARTRLGAQSPTGTFAASHQDGLVAWVDVSGSPELRVYDLAEREVVGATEVDDETRVLAIEGRVVYVQSADGAYAFEHGRGWAALARVGPEKLLDVAGVASVFQYGPQVLLVSRGSELGVGLTRPGTGAQLAPEGDYVLTRAGGSESPGRVRIYETIEGEELDTGLTPDAEVRAAKLGGRGRATYLVERGPDSLELVTCPLVAPGYFTSCTVHRTFPRSPSATLAQ